MAKRLTAEPRQATTREQAKASGPSPRIRELRLGVREGQKEVVVPADLFETMCRSWFMEYGTVAFSKRQDEQEKDPAWAESRGLTDEDRAELNKALKAYDDYDRAEGRGKYAKGTSKAPARSEGQAGETPEEAKRRKRRERRELRKKRAAAGG